MNFYFVPTFQDICGVRMAEILWNHNILVLTTLSEMVPEDSYFYQIQNQVCNDVELLDVRIENCLPAAKFRQLIKAYVKSLGYEILLWKIYEYYKWKLDLPTPNTIYWTVRGLLDRKKIANAMVKDETLDIMVRYKLACIYCLENGVAVLWHSMHVNQKKEIHEELCSVGFSARYEIGFWTCYILGILSGSGITIPRAMNTNFCPYRIGFYSALNDNNKIAAEYFFNKMRLQEQIRILSTRSCNYHPVYSFIVDDDYNFIWYFSDIYRESRNEILCFLLSKMDENQLSNFLRSRPSDILKCFLKWPWQTLFIEVANRISDLFRAQEYLNFFKDIQYLGEYGWIDLSLTLFEEFWKICRDDLKKILVFLAFCHGSPMNLMLFHTIDDKYARVFFKHVLISDKMKRIFEEGEKICKTLAYNQKWDMIKYFVYECIPTQGHFVKFKSLCEEKFKQYLFETKNLYIDALLTFLDQLGLEYEINRNQYLAC